MSRTGRTTRPSKTSRDRHEQTSDFRITSVIVTGASSGIGRALARELSRHGRMTGDLRHAAKIGFRNWLAENSAPRGRRVWYRAGDITSPEVRAAVLQAAQDELGGLDLLVNNAGVGAIGPFADADEERLRRVMEVNFFAPAELMRAALALVAHGRRPMIVNVSLRPGPSRGAARRASTVPANSRLHGLSDALRAELDKQRHRPAACQPEHDGERVFRKCAGEPGRLPWLAGRQDVGRARRAPDGPRHSAAGGMRSSFRRAASCWSGSTDSLRRWSTDSSRASGDSIPRENRFLRRTR